MKNLHTEFLNDLLVELGKHPHLGRYWKQNTGIAKVGDRVIRFGLPGAADITGLMPNGIRVEIECKTGTGRLSEIQGRFRNMITDLGGLYMEAREIEKVIAVLEELCH